jgi:hypothetical protein
MAALLACLAAGVDGASAGESQRWSGEAGVGIGVRTHGDDRITQKELQVIGSLDDEWDNGYYKAKGRARYDMRYEGDDAYSAQAADAYRFSSDWRHLYLGHYVGEGELTAGWQQVVWGRADELRVLDRINPVDYRRGVTALLEESRIVVPMIRLTYPVGDWEIESLFVPRFEKNRYPEAGSEFEAPPFAEPDPEIFSVDARADAGGSAGQSYGFNASGRVGSIDTTLVALSAPRQDPVYTVAGMQPDGRIALCREFPRYHMLGGGLAADVGYSVVIRTEVAWLSGWQVTNPLRSRGTDETAAVNALLGVDYLWRDWLVSAQWQEQQITDWQPGMVEAERQHLFTLSAEGTAYQDRLKNRLVLAFTPPYRDDLLLQGIFTYKPSDSIRLGLEINVFFGREESLFGVYDERDHLKISAAYIY